MESKNKTIEVCVGIGLDQLTPQYVTIEIPSESEEKTENAAPKKRGRKPKKDEGGQAK